ncbi:hypothetical protein DM860_004001 [Cuscuta australis]|uniref:Uncharacterized protein n=1 Tax=Cuscuta australis TaxID=267555 RepID=A0A328CYG3_9ASTE|nr:hypothetical protein DM860_004001 [Cuscuta australis]
MHQLLGVMDIVNPEALQRSLERNLRSILQNYKMNVDLAEGISPHHPALEIKRSRELIGDIHHTDKNLSQILDTSSKLNWWAPPMHIHVAFLIMRAPVMLASVVSFMFLAYEMFIHVRIPSFLMVYSCVNGRILVIRNMYSIRGLSTSGIAPRPQWSTINDLLSAMSTINQVQSDKIWLTSKAVDEALQLERESKELNEYKILITSVDHL